MISIARALVTQRKAFSALSGVTFSFDPQIATLDTFPRSLIAVTTSRQAIDSQAVVPFVAIEQLCVRVSDQDASGFETTLKLLKQTIRKNPLYFSKECRIHNQKFAGERLSLMGNARVAEITWIGFASWEDV